MLECVISLLIISIMFSLGVQKETNVDYHHFQFMDDYYKSQMEAIQKRDYVVYDDYGYISFNEKGHVNKGKTVHFPIHRVYVHVGNGSLRYE